eukprot:TRINITY_DN32014_c0_g1_i1.p1 TRINITY_DN32014_c0_g1~~TRINITY_DN32014_c0_g1_i1.p1  ORF type:complete len:109 (-),score=25.06 TRINITY_DN32014_c0_g1_i1:116-442(-)
MLQRRVTPLLPSPRQQACLRRNDVENHPTHRFPTVLLFPAGDAKDKVVPYKGDRSLNDMQEFLHRHCMHNFSDTPPPSPAADADARSDGELSGLLTPDEESHGDELDL